MSAAATTAPEPAVILCVEDEEDLRRDLCEELREAGYTVREAADGEAALRQLADCRPDLVLCDISMPGLDGYDVLRLLRERHPDQAETPFVFLSALANPREVIAGKRLGADDYLVKPVDFDLVLATVEARLRQIARIRTRSREELDSLRAAFQVASGSRTEAAMGGAEQALNLVATGLVLLDSEMGVCMANHRARQIALQTDALEIGTTLSCRSPQHGTALKTMFGDIIGLALDGQEGTGCYALPRSDGQRDLMVVARAIPSSAGTAVGQAVVAIFISDPETGPAVTPAVLSSLFGLTPTEARIALGLAEGKRPARIADDLGVAQTTVAFHMRNLFQKTNTSRQAELVALILSSPAPLAVSSYSQS